MSKSKSLLAVAKTLKRRTKATWFDRASQDELKQLAELRDAYRSGELGELSIRQLHEEVIKAAGLAIGITAFGAWMKSK